MLADNKIKLIITDDHKIIREGLCSLLSSNDKIEIVGQASDGLETLDLLSRIQADIVLMDINMPGMNGYDATRSICELYATTKVVALSVLTDENCIRRMMESGASGYVLKSAGKDELYMALQLVHNGTPYISSDASIRLLGKVLNNGNGKDTVAATEKQLLSKRELEVLALIAEGYTNAEIADKLFTSKRTIETHRHNILEKIKTRNTAHLVKYALQNGLID